MRLESEGFTGENHIKCIFARNSLGEARPFSVMDALLNLNEILNREHITVEITRILAMFDENVNNVQFKKGIYIQGSPGSGKTQFVLNLLKKLEFDEIRRRRCSQQIVN